MQDYLVFQLYAPLVSWGEQAVGQERPSSDHPSRSALLGLLAAALGITREDEKQQHALQKSCLFAIKHYSSGIVLRDFHTVQAPATLSKIHHLQSRKDELAMNKLGTIISYRTYYQDNLAIIAIALTENAVFSLTEIVQALEKPHYQLYLGRKSCPIAIPLKPKIITAQNIKAVLNVYCVDKALSFLKKNKSVHYYWEQGIRSGFKTTFKVPRYDEPISRKRWQFRARDEYVYLEQKQGGK